MKSKIRLGAAACVIGAAIVVSAQQSAPPVKVRGATIAPKTACATLSGRTIAASRIGLPTGGTKITSATLKPGTGTGIAVVADYVPEYCEVNAEMAPVDPTAPPIIFQVNIPTKWNQMAYQFGVDGSDGHVPDLVVIPRAAFVPPLGYNYPPDVPFPVALGYATFAGNAGHGTGPVVGGGGGPIPGQTSYADDAAAGRRGGGGRGAPAAGEGAARGGAAPAPAANPGAGNAWMKNDESFKNFAFEHVKKTHDAAFAIIEDMYGVRPRTMYFVGESNGGKSGLNALSRFGADYDGIFSGVPIPYYSARAISQERMRELQRQPGGWVPPAKAAVIRNEIVRQCDSLDGHADGIIYNYVECLRLMNPEITPNPLAKIRCAGGADTGNDCLSDAQMASVNGMHSPTKLGFPMANGESDYPMWTVAAEAPVGWLVQPVNPATAPPGGTNAMLQARVPGWEPAKIGHWDEKEKAAIQALSNLVDSREDWSAFLKHNGKFLLYAAGSDYQVNGPVGAMRFYEQGGKKNDKAAFDRNTRFYVAPNSGHGSWGISATTGEKLPYHADLITILADWVEKGIAPPDAIQQTLKDPKPPYAYTISRPLCRFPMYPRYNGSGDHNKMENWKCAAPKPGPSPAAPSVSTTASAR